MSYHQRGRRGFCSLLLLSIFNNPIGYCTSSGSSISPQELFKRTFDTKCDEFVANFTGTVCSKTDVHHRKSMEYYLSHVGKLMQASLESTATSCGLVYKDYLEVRSRPTKRSLKRKSIEESFLTEFYLDTLLACLKKARARAIEEQKLLQCVKDHPDYNGDTDYHNVNYRNILHPLFRFDPLPTEPSKKYNKYTDPMIDHLR